MVPGEQDILLDKKEECISRLGDSENQRDCLEVNEFALHVTHPRNDPLNTEQGVNSK